MAITNTPIKKIGIITHPSELDEQDTFFLFINEIITRKNLEVFVFDVADVSGESTVQAACIDRPITFSSRNMLDSKDVRMQLRDFHVIFLKRDPPIDDAYALLLQKLLAQGVPTVNHAKGIQTMGSKAYLQNFSDILPPTFFVHTVEEALQSIKKMGNSIVKQSDSYGGKGVQHLRYQSGKFYGFDGQNKIPLSESEVSERVTEYLRQSTDQTLLVVEYLPSAPKRGDKRVVILEGEILGSYIRLPDSETGMCACENNGARLYDPTVRDHAIAAALRPHFKKNGIELAALDLLVGKDGMEYLSEINVVNPGFCNLDVMHPEINIAKKIVDMLCRKMA